MNWYYEDNGVAQGPLPEGELESKVRAKALTAEALIWHVGAAQWQAVRDFRPKWLEEPKPKAAPAVAAAVEPAPERKAAAAKIPKPLTVAAAEPPAAAPVEKQGLFKRLFGMGKKS
jgi:hypothetical protein